MRGEGSYSQHLYIYTDDSIFIPLNSTKPASVLCVSFTTDNNDIIHHNFLSVSKSVSLH